MNIGDIGFFIFALGPLAMCILVILIARRVQTLAGPIIMLIALTAGVLWGLHVKPYIDARFGEIDSGRLESERSP